MIFSHAHCSNCLSYQSLYFPEGFFFFNMGTEDILVVALDIIKDIKKALDFIHQQGRPTSIWLQTNVSLKYRHAKIEW